MGLARIVIVSTIKYTKGTHTRCDGVNFHYVQQTWYYVSGYTHYTRVQVRILVFIYTEPSETTR